MVLRIRLPLESRAAPLTILKLALTTALITCDGVLAEVKGCLKRLTLVNPSVANRSPAALNASWLLVIVVPLLNVAEAVALLLRGALKTAKSPNWSPAAILPLLSTARPNTKVVDKPTVDVDVLVTGNVNC